MASDLWAYMLISLVISYDTGGTFSNSQGISFKVLQILPQKHQSTSQKI